MKIHVYAVCWNEERMLPYFLRHYSQFADKIFVYENGSTDSSLDILKQNKKVKILNFKTREKLDETVLTRLRSNAYKKSRGKADFVIVVDIDEFIYHPHILDVLERYKRQGITLPKIQGFEMVADSFPKTEGQIYSEVKMGITDNVNIKGHYHRFSKRVIFNPDIDINFDSGSHSCKPKGNIIESKKAELKLLHFNYVGLDYIIDKYNRYNKRGLSKSTVKSGCAIQYKWDAEKIRIIHNKIKINSSNVFEYDPDKSIIIVTDRRLFPRTHGNYGGNMVRIHTLIRNLKSYGFNIILITGKTEENVSNQDKLGILVDNLILVDCFDEFKGGRLKDFDASPFYDAVEKAFFDYDPLAVIAEYVWMAPCLDKIKNDAIKMIDMHDIMHTRQSVTPKGVNPWIICTKEEEVDMIRKADVLIAIQKNETEKIKEMVPKKRVITLMHTLPVMIQKSDNNTKKEVIMLAGCYNYDNIYSLNTFLFKIWPIVEKTCPKVELHVYGFLSKAVPPLLSRIKRFGFVENLDDAYKDAGVVINPAMSGTGLKIKSVEALCHGKALVTTSFGASGIEDGNNKAFIVEDDSERFGKAVVSLLTDRERRKNLEKEALRFAEKTFSKDSVYKDILNELNDIYKRRKSSQ